MNHGNRVYTIMLVMLSIFLLLSIGEMFIIPRFVAIPPRGELVLDYMKAVLSVYFAAAIITLVLRATHPAAGRVAATALNLALLAVIPFGTVVGIFGLAKLDKEDV
jgi:hypothetical protein